MQQTPTFKMQGKNTGTTYGSLDFINRTMSQPSYRSIPLLCNMVYSLREIYMYRNKTGLKMNS